MPNIFLFLFFAAFGFGNYLWGYWVAKRLYHRITRRVMDFAADEQLKQDAQSMSDTLKMFRAWINQKSPQKETIISTLDEYIEYYETEAAVISVKEIIDKK